MNPTLLQQKTHDYTLVNHSIGGKEQTIALPVSFTPYASVKPCSARCVFCSEALVPKKSRMLSADLRPGPNYFKGLEAVLEQLHGLPMGISLSGLEPTDAPHWLMQVVMRLSQHENRGLLVRKKVLYTNGNGFARSEGPDLIRTLRDFDLDQVQLVRHHFLSERNQDLMRFRTQQSIRYPETFEGVVKRLRDAFPLRLVCLVQRGGVARLEDLQAYLEWAQSLGISSVVFREFARLDDAYKENLTYRNVEHRRVDIEFLIQQVREHASEEFRFDTFSQGYYYWSLKGTWRQEVNVHFESSDYLMMKRSHQTRVVRKLIYHANGNLCGDWDPEKHVLYKSPPFSALFAGV